MHQMGHGGLAIGAGDADPGHGPAGPPGPHQLPLHRHPPGPQCLQGRMVEADAGTHHHGGGRRGEGIEAVGIKGQAQLHRDALRLQGRRLLSQGVAAAAFREPHRFAESPKQSSSADSGATQTHHHRALPFAGGHREFCRIGPQITGQGPGSRSLGRLSSATARHADARLKRGSELGAAREPGGSHPGNSKDRS